MKATLALIGLIANLQPAALEAPLAVQAQTPAAKRDVGPKKLEFKDAAVQFALAFADGRETKAPRGFKRAVSTTLEGMKQPGVIAFTTLSEKRDVDQYIAAVKSEFEKQKKPLERQWQLEVAGSPFGLNKWNENERRIIEGVYFTAKDKKVKLRLESSIEDGDYFESALTQVLEGMSIIEPKAAPVVVERNVDLLRDPVKRPYLAPQIVSAAVDSQPLEVRLTRELAWKPVADQPNKYQIVTNKLAKPVDVQFWINSAESQQQMMRRIASGLDAFMRVDKRYDLVDLNQTPAGMYRSTFVYRYGVSKDNQPMFGAQLYLNSPESVFMLIEYRYVGADAAKVRSVLELIAREVRFMKK